MENLDYMYYQYEILYNDTDEGQAIVRSGILYAANFTEAVSQLENYYGVDDIIEINLITPLSDCSVLDFMDINWDLRQGWSIIHLKN